MAMRQKNGTEYAKEQRELWTWQRRVLEHLKTHGPINYDTLYVLFDQDRSAMIGPALQDLRAWKFIEISQNKTVTITALGLERIQSDLYR